MNYILKQVSTKLSEKYKMFFKVNFMEQTLLNKFSEILTKPTILNNAAPIVSSDDVARKVSWGSIH